MKYLIDKLSYLGILKVTVLGTLNQDIRKEIFLKAVSELNTNGYQKLLVDVTGSKVSKNSKVRTIHTFDMVDCIKKIKKKNHTQIAVLNKDRVEDDRKDYEKLLQLMGQVQMKHFINYEEAITWLLGDKDIFT